MNIATQKEFIWMVASIEAIARMASLAMALRIASGGAHAEQLASLSTIPYWTVDYKRK